MDLRSSEQAGAGTAPAEDLPFRELGQHLATPCWISDPDGRIIWVNDAWIAYTGATIESIETEGLKRLHDPTAYDEIARKWAAVKAAGVADEMTFPLRGRDGTLRPFHTRVTPLRDRHGRIAGWLGVNTDLSVQIEIEDRLRSSEEQLREVFERAGDAIFITSADGRLIDVNAAACAMSQYSKAELLSKSVTDLVDPQDQGVLVQARSQDASIRDWRIKRKDGGCVEVEISSRRLSDGRRIGVARDVSTRRLAAEAEKKALSALVSAHATRASDAERQLQRFWDASRDLFAIISNHDGRPRMINDRAWKETLGYDREEILSRRLMELVHPDDRETTLAMRKSHPNESYFGFENRYLHKDGRVVWLSWNVVREADLIYCNARDITAEKRAAESLAASEGQFRMLVAGVVDYALFMLNPDGTVANWNAGAQRIKGYSAEEIVGRHIRHFYTEADRAAGRPALALRTAAEQGRYEAEGWRVRKDGALFWANVVIDAIRDHNGRLIGFAKITRDITERRDAQLELQQANERLAQAQKMEALGQLTGGVAHDFNNLLMVMGGQAELLRGRIGEDPRVIRSLDAIAAAAHRGRELTRHLLAFARRQRLQPAPVSLASRAGDLEALLTSSLGANVALTVDCPADLWTVEVDVNEWELAVLNMAVNARDAMPAGGRLAIVARNRTLPGAEGGEELRGDVVELTVSDTGEGIPADILPRVVDPFFTTKEVNKGTGLGLSQVYGFVQQSGGRMKIDSRLGEGTTITIQLPRALCEPAAPAPSIAESPADSLDILCVEDNAEVAEVAGGLLARLGHSVRMVHSAAAARQILENGPAPNLVFSDIVMAGDVDGLGLAREIRRRWPGLPILLATGYSRQAEAIGAEFPILAKPYRIEDLSRAINAVSNAVHPG
jgi:PAS domain S-box-containing protein